MVSWFPATHAVRLPGTYFSGGLRVWNVSLSLSHTHHSLTHFHILCSLFFFFICLLVLFFILLYYFHITIIFNYFVYCFKLAFSIQLGWRASAREGPPVKEKRERFAWSDFDLPPRSEARSFFQSYPDIRQPRN